MLRDQGPTNVVLKENYMSLSGYRLPTEGEMEYATRAGAATSRYYGETEELLTNYTWYIKNSGDRLQRVSLKKPNEFGLFDVQGNCFSWCQDSYYSYPRADDGQVAKNEHAIISTNNYLMRGGSFANHQSGVRSSERLAFMPTFDSGTLGFRVARTFIP